MTFLKKKWELVDYRLKQAEESLDEARFLWEGKKSSRSIINRAYYAMFYAVLGLLVFEPYSSSKHSGVVSYFNQKFVKNGIFPKETGRALHRAFELRQRVDYKEYVDIPYDEVISIINAAETFVKITRTHLELKKTGKLILKTDSADETFFLGERLAALVESGDVFAVSGELGAGKTVLARGLARGLGVARPVKSPTFTLINEYAGRLPFYHLDVYRLSGPLEMADLGGEEYFYGSGVTLVEWAERVAEILPPERLEIKMEIVPGEENARKITLLPRGERYRRLVEELLGGTFVSSRKQ